MIEMRVYCSVVANGEFGMGIFVYVSVCMFVGMENMGVIGANSRSHRAPSLEQHLRSHSCRSDCVMSQARRTVLLGMMIVAGCPRVSL